MNQGIERPVKKYPLEGYRIVDFGWVMAGPILGQFLADMGAEVIKIESRKRLDAARRGRPIIGGKIELGDVGEQPDLIPLFHNVNRGKLSITLDIGHPKSAVIIKDLVKRSDIVIENFTPHVLKNAGLDYPALREVKPDLVMVSLSSVGQYGPMRDISTYAPAITALSGMDSFVGYPDEPIQSMIGLNFADPVGSIYGMVAVLAALHHRDRTGEGQYVDLSQMEAAICLLGEPVMDYAMNGRIQTPPGNRHPTMVPHGNYPCRSAEEDKWVAIAVENEVEWKSLCDAMGNPTWSGDEKFADKFRRLKNREALDRYVSEWTINYSHYEVMEKLQKAGVAATPVLNVEEQFNDPHFRERKVFIECEHPLVGIEHIYGLTWKLSETPGEVRRYAPLLGEHNTYILGELLGLSTTEITTLIEEKIVY